MEDQESCKRALQVQQALGTTAKHEMGSWKPAEQQHLTSNTHTPFLHSEKIKKKSLFRDGQQWQTWWSWTSATGVWGQQRKRLRTLHCWWWSCFHVTWLISWVAPALSLVSAPPQVSSAVFTGKFWLQASCVDLAAKENTMWECLASAAALTTGGSSAKYSGGNSRFINTVRAEICSSYKQTTSLDFCVGHRLILLFVSGFFDLCPHNKVISLATFPWKSV